jgi:hypothetical protein
MRGAPVKTPSFGALRQDCDELVERLRAKLDLIVKRTERTAEGIDYMVLVEDLDGQERTIWSHHLGFARGFEKRAPLVAAEQDRVAEDVWTLCWPSGAIG